MPLRVAAISFLNPAPLLYNFEHAPANRDLLARYDVHYTTPARCAAELHAGTADLGLIPIAELTPDLAIVPGCTIASLDEVRSILLLLRIPGTQAAADAQPADAQPADAQHADVQPADAQHAETNLTQALRSVTTLAADTASRSSAAYVRVILERFYGARPQLVQHEADPLAMLAAHPAALLIGDPALIARERRPRIDQAIAAEGDSLLWLDLAQLWRQHTGLPWVAAVWAVRPAALATAGITPAQLTADLLGSRDAGQAHVEDLVREWSARLPLSPSTIRTYLTRNIHYHLDPDCVEAIGLFRALAASLGVLPPLPGLHLLRS